MTTTPTIEAPPDALPSVCLSVVVYNTWSDARDCIESFKSQSYMGKLELAIWDNSDSHFEEAEPYKDITDRTDRNVGFGAGHNFNFGRSTSELFLILNPDVTLPVDFLGKAVEELSAHRATAIAPRLSSSTGVMEVSLRRFPSLGTEAARALGVDHVTGLGTVLGPAAHSQARPVDQPPGAALLVRRDAFAAIGGFDTGFPLYFEDVDLCRRLWEVGEIWYCPAASAIHQREGTARHYRERTIFWIEWSRRHYIRKHFFGVRKNVMLAFTVVGVALRACVFTVCGMLAPRFRSRGRGYRLGLISAFKGNTEYWIQRMLSDSA